MELNALRYVTSRAILGLIFCFILSMLVYPAFIARLRAKNVSQGIRDDGPKTHADKTGTPTMGGVVILLVTTLGVLLWNKLDSPLVWVVTINMLCFGAIGFMDDWLKFKFNNAKGLKGSYKLVASAIVLTIMLMILHRTGTDFFIVMPFFKDLIVSLPYIVVPFIFIVVLGTSNAANLTDGLDGLLAGILLVILSTIAVLCYLAGHIYIAKYLYIPFVPGASELTVLCACLFGAVTGFLWFNSHPAAIFMGDSGSLSIGATVGLISVIIHHEFLMLICGGVLALEALSVIFQVVSYKLFKKRIFLMAPLHHHFELKGWREPQVITRFWIISFLLAIMTIMTLKLR